MPVRNLATFKQETRLSAKGFRQGKFRDVRGKKIKPIDNALQAYDLVSVAGTPVQQTQALSLLLTQCAHWLKEKRPKTGTDVGTRRAIIDALAREVFTEIRALNGATGIDFFHMHKARNFGGPAAIVPHVKALSPGYRNERAVYLSGGKAAHPPAAGMVHDQQIAMRDPQIGLPQGFRTAEMQTIVAKQFSALSDTDYQKIAAAAGSSGSAANVHFADKAVRSAQLLVVYPGAAVSFEHPAGAPYDTQAEPAGFMYAMDEYGSLFASPATGLAVGGDYWNHSSFNAGKDVVCAGIIRIHNGVLVYVDNASGHYRPQRGDLHYMLTVLQAEIGNIAANAVQVVIREPSVVVPGQVDVHSLDAAAFFTNVDLQDPLMQTVPA